MAEKVFFDETTEQSIVKSTIVKKYFWAWARVIIPTAKMHYGKIAYVDLFAGPGRYRDGTMSTPLLILEQAIQDPEMREMLVTVFNDKNEENYRSLKEAINILDGIKDLKYQPIVTNKEVGIDIVSMLEKTRFVPTLFFVDPWGYKGLSLRLVNSVLKDWGCDCIFFFNYNRINMGLNNPKIQEHMNALFGKDRADELRPILEVMNPRDRELTVVEKLSEALFEMGGKYVLPFCFKTSSGTRSSHHLIFVSKNFRGYEIMKDIMARESSVSEQGVPSFAYNPADRIYPLLFELSRPLDELGDMLQQEFAGRTLTMEHVYEQHNVGRPYVKRNYKQVLIGLEQAGKISAKPSAEKRRKGTFADHVLITFPET
ncbi:MAG: three-Cys-motif partner protein TcmP [Deltaproteobacteria bacterium]|nr:three-Cys-motif partner protein TcmP [Deltaproteobacteria bacterium]